MDVVYLVAEVSQDYNENQVIDKVVNFFTNYQAAENFVNDLKEKQNKISQYNEEVSRLSKIEYNKLSDEYDITNPKPFFNLNGLFKPVYTPENPNFETELNKYREQVKEMRKLHEKAIKAWHSKKDREINSKVYAFKSSRIVPCFDVQYEIITVEKGE